MTNIRDLCNICQQQLDKLREIRQHIFEEIIDLTYKSPQTCTFEGFHLLWWLWAHMIPIFSFISILLYLFISRMASSVDETYQTLKELMLVLDMYDICVLGCQQWQKPSCIEKVSDKCHSPHYGYSWSNGESKRGSFTW